MNNAAKENIILLSLAKGSAFLIGPSGHISHFNNDFAAFLCAGADEIKGKQLAHFIVPKERDAAKRLVQEALEGVPSHGHLAFLTNTVDKRIGKTTLTPYFESGCIAGVIGFIQDVTETVNHNRNLYDGEQRLKAIFEHEPDCVAVLSLNGAIIDLNPAGLQLLQGTKEQLLSFTFHELVGLSHRPQFRATYEQVGKGETKSLQFEITNLAGENRWLEANIVPLRDKYEAIYATLSVMRDISERKKIEEELRKQQERLLNIKRLAKIGYWEFDFLTGKGYATDSLYAIYGLRRSDHPEITVPLFLSLVHPDDRDELAHGFATVVECDSLEKEHRLLRPDGSLVHLHHCGTVFRDADGNALSMGGAVQDITDRKEAEIQLTFSEQKFRSLVHNGSDLIVILDEEGNFKYVSPSAKNIAGYEPAELLGRNAFELIPPEDHEVMMAELHSVIQSKNSGKATPHRFLNAAGEWMWLESKGVNLLHDTNVEGIIINARNITDRIELQEQLDRELATRQKDITAAVIQAQEGERSQLGQELHDNVNQVLTTIKLYNEMLLDGIGNSKELLQKSVHHLQSCISEIRSISKRLSAPTLGKINLNDSIYELIESVNLTKKIAIHFSMPVDVALPVTQEIHLTIYRIIQEQLNNIIKHADATVVTIALLHCKKGFELIIQDDGKGFDVGAKRTGIGITNIITRAENVSGKVKIESSTGNGCKLTVTIPPIS